MKPRRFGTVAFVACALCACGGGGETTVPGTAAAAGTSVALPDPPVLPAVQVPSEANTFTCSNVSVDAQSIDTVFVPSGATCALSGTRLIGSIKVDVNGTLDARDVHVNGNLQADGAANVLLAGASRIGGSVQIKQGRAATIVNAQITGDLQLIDNSALLSAQHNRVNGNIQVFENSGGVVVQTNTANGNLQCKQNQPAPTGGGNRAALKEDQCSML